MIRSCISEFSNASESCLSGPFAWRDSGGQLKNFPLYLEGSAENAYLLQESLRLEDTAAIYKALHGACLARRMQLGLAESCTGGLISALITDNSGSSAYLYGGWVVYSNHANFNWLQVSPHDLEQDGAVSFRVVEDLLEGVFANSPCSHAIAVSGIAGPDGGSTAKPVGTVWIGVAGKQGVKLLREFRFGGDRMAIRTAAAQAAALMLLELIWLMENKIDTSWKL